MIELIWTPWKNRLIEIVSKAKSRLLISSPWIKLEVLSQILESIPYNAPGFDLRILSRFNIGDFLNKISDFEAIYLLEECDVLCNIRVVNNLHAKLFIVDDNIAVVGSSNLTNQGLFSNIELVVKIEDENIVSELCKVFCRYYNEADRLDSDTIKLYREAILQRSETQESSSDPEVSLFLPGVTSIVGRRIKPHGVDIQPLTKSAQSRASISKKIYSSLRKRKIVVNYKKEIPEDVKNLISMLSNGTPKEKRGVMEKKVNRDNIDFVKNTLMERLSDEHPLVRTIAAETLGEYGIVEAVPLLRVILDSDYSLSARAAAAKALGAVGASESVDLLVEHLNDPSRDVRRWCGRALGRLTYNLEIQLRSSPNIIAATMARLKLSFVDAEKFCEQYPEIANSIYAEKKYILEYAYKEGISYDNAIEIWNKNHPV